MKGKGQRADLQKNARCYKSILQSSGYYPYVAQAQTAIPALPSSDYQRILPQPRLSHCRRPL